MVQIFFPFPLPWIAVDFRNKAHFHSKLLFDGSEHISGFKPVLPILRNRKFCDKEKEERSFSI
jgi:hypothetical protein